MEGGKEGREEWRKGGRERGRKGGKRKRVKEVRGDGTADKTVCFMLTNNCKLKRLL